MQLIGDMSSHRKKEARIRALYERIPEIECKGLCADQCTAILMSKTEERTLEEAGHEVPQVLDVLRSESHRCPLLCPSSGRCTAYRERPTICRLYGVSPSMECQYGCKPKRMLTESEAGGIMRQVMAIGGRSSSHVIFD